MKFARHLDALDRDGFVVLDGDTHTQSRLAKKIREVRPDVTAEFYDITTSIKSYTRPEGELVASTNCVMTIESLIGPAEAIAAHRERISSTPPTSPS